MGFETRARLSGVPLAGRSAADTHFLNRRGRGFASNDSPDAQPARTRPGPAHRCHFSVFHADRVSVTSTQFTGGDWRWRLSDQEGAILVEAGGYRSEAHCRNAVAILQAHSSRATLV